MPKNASQSADGFRFYEWAPPGKEPVKLLSVTSIRKLCGLPFGLVEWQLGNIANLVTGTRRIEKIGPRGGVKKSYVADNDTFFTMLEAAQGDSEKLAYLRKWVRTTADEPRDIAAVRGTVVHEAIERGVATSDLTDEYIQHAFSRDRKGAGLDITDVDREFIRACVRQYWNMRDDVPFVVLAREPQVYNLTAGYGGSADVLIWFLPPNDNQTVYWQKLADEGTLMLSDIEEVGGEIVLGDWKTSEGVYCVGVDTPVLTDDLRWVSAGSLRPGDGLWAFTEDRVNAGKKGRRWERSVVTHNESRDADTLRVRLASGRDLICTPDHPFLTHRSAGGRRMKEGGALWVRARDLRPGNALYRYLDTWPDAAREGDYEAGWFAGLLDGEGSLSGRRLSFAQKEGVVAERARAFMRGRRIEWTENQQPAAIQFYIRGTMSDHARLLGYVRANRLIAKFQPNELQTARSRRDVVIAVEPAGEQRIASLTTTSATYFSAGYGSHNTDHVVQLHAYLAGEFVGADGVIDERLTPMLNAAMKGALIHIRPNRWTIHYVEWQPNTVLRAFLGSVAFARFLATHQTPDELFCEEKTGSAE